LVGPGGDVAVLVGDELVWGGGGEGAQLGDEGLAGAVADVADDEVGAVLGPVAGKGGAEARGAAGDEDGLAGEGGGVVGLGAVDGRGLVDQVGDAPGLVSGRDVHGGLFVGCLFSATLLVRGIRDMVV
jgi:hypothetical protein